MRKQFQYKVVLVDNITVTDPDTKAPVQVSIYKDTNSGGMFGIDSSFLSKEDKPIKINSPFDKLVYYKI